jgi:hypothetical protein
MIVMFNEITENEDGGENRGSGIRFNTSALPSVHAERCIAGRNASK